MSDPDLTTPEGVAQIMRSSKNNQEWSDNADRVKAANGNDYPSFWWRTVILSGILSMCRDQWSAR